ncbi:MAG TPA: hypothetical protein VJ761_05295 [Ktedonobacteraceae bacterium]|nr:hypothetical protein [Ktedonobacteraceae bacterium]
MSSTLPPGATPAPKIGEQYQERKAAEQERVFFVSEHGLPHATISTNDLGCLLTTHVLGRVLTILDASIADSRQCKAAKDLAKQAIWAAFFEVKEWMEKNARNTENPTTVFPFSDNRSVE